MDSDKDGMLDVIELLRKHGLEWKDQIGSCKNLRRLSAAQKLQLAVWAFKVPGYSGFRMAHEDQGFGLQASTPFGLP